ncbi:hypothetical protein S40288_10102 [Stachybotrys chartarum IBT 40288]|nr:hypothetical protein S40288_10102 [Stachybotrys chartarum IBT 40288]
MATQLTVPYREIRALHDDNTITVYQAYNTSIAEAAVASQRLNASPDFKLTRMTWIKPSWAWIMYRSGYSFKDPGQARILALKMRHQHFISLLEQGVLSSQAAKDSKDGPAACVRIQWDPERTPRLGVLPYRSIQVGIPAALSATWVGEWIEEIQDVTEVARSLKKALDEDPNVTTEELVQRGLVPPEKPFPVSQNLRERLGMDISA